MQTLKVLRAGETGELELTDSHWRLVFPSWQLQEPWSQVRFIDRPAPFSLRISYAERESVSVAFMSVRACTEAAAAFESRTANSQQASERASREAGNRRAAAGQELALLQDVCDSLFGVAPFLDPEILRFDDEVALRLQYSHAGYLMVSNNSGRWSILDVVVNPFTGEPIVPMPPEALQVIEDPSSTDDVAAAVLRTCVREWYDVMRRPDASDEVRKEAESRVLALQASLDATTDAAAPEPGWYADPDEPGSKRWWTGTTWGPRRP